MKNEIIDTVSIRLGDLSFSEKEALQEIERIAKRLRESGDISIADEAEETLLGLQRISGKSLAALLFYKKKWWEESGQDETRGCSFEDYEFSRHGLNRYLIDRYITVWEHINNFPPQFRTRPIRDLIPVAKALQQGYEIKEEDWGRLLSSSSNQEVGAIVREIKGKPPKQGTRIILLERDGVLVLYDNGERKPLGLLNINSEDRAVQEAIAYILSDKVRRI